MSEINSSTKHLRIVAWIEGISYLLLLFIAMPLKYLADQPAMVQYTGMIHGVLFVVFIFKAVEAKIALGWSAKRLVAVIGTAFIPFGMVVFDRMMEARTSRTNKEQTV